LDGLTNKLNVTPVSQFEENGNLLKATGGERHIPRIPARLLSSRPSRKNVVASIRITGVALFAVLVLEWYERKILLVGWWLEAVAGVV